MYKLLAFKYVTDKFCVIISFPKPKYYICGANDHGMKNRTHTQSHTCSLILGQYDLLFKAKKWNTYLFYSSDVFFSIVLTFVLPGALLVLHNAPIEANEATTETRVQVCEARTSRKWVRGLPYVKSRQTVRRHQIKENQDTERRCN